MYPLVETVQVSSMLYISFKSSHSLYKGASIKIKLPENLILPALDTQLDVTPFLGSTRATKAFMREDRTVEIPNFV
jgi:hypothetical protein